jgi:putative component of membrane protein insertase Oxa1/YidC/SpoIIIJ protein YidD
MVREGEINVVGFGMVNFLNWFIFWMRIKFCYFVKTCSNDACRLIHQKHTIKNKKYTTQVNELLCKILCHNLVVVIHETNELGIACNFVGGLK